MVCTTFITFYIEAIEIIDEETCIWLLTSLLGARTLLGALGLTTRNKKLLGAMRLLDAFGHLYISFQNTGAFAHSSVN